jgi:hypothetical protein
MSDNKLPQKQYVRSCPYCQVVFTTTSSARISCGSVECDKAARAGRNWRYREGYCAGAPDPKLAKRRKVKASKNSRDYRERKKRKGRGLTAEPPNNEALRKPPVREHGENELDANAA